MPVSLAERIVNRVAERTERPRTSRRGFLGGAALVGAALAVNPWSYLTRPASAYSTVCGAHNTCGSGYSVFCCTINGGLNTCPPDSFIGGWWKADNSSFCGGRARYYIDCNAYRDGRYGCRCNTTTCDQRLVACNQFRYGQCNTQIPWSSTGPVLCRMISCTPPWVQFGGTCSSSSATDNNTASHSAPCLAHKAPVGYVDLIASTANTVRIKGWTYDPNQPGSSLYVHIYQDGKFLRQVLANKPRPDVNTARKVTGQHGFDISFTATNGYHYYSVWAINIGPAGSNPRLGGKGITINPGVAPYGYLDSAVAVGSSVVLTGWAFDRDVPTTSIGIAVYQDGKRLPDTKTTVNRPDVNAAYKITGLHGFKITIPTTPGSHVYRVWALNAGGGSNAFVAQRTVVVPAPNPGVAPNGSLDSAVVVDSSVVLTGWAFDRDVPTVSIGIAVYQDGIRLPDTKTTVNRPDVNATYKITGIHGFEITIPTTPGSHVYRIWALNAGGGTSNTFLAERTVVVPAPTPAVAPAGMAPAGMAGAGMAPASIALAVAGTPARLSGELDSITAAGNSVRLVGWVADPDPAGSEPAVAVYEDDHALHWYPARSDPAAFDRATGRRAFDFTIPAGTGVHTYTAYALGDAILAESDSEDGEIPPIGQHTVRVNQSGPLGTVESVRRIGDTVRITGWAYDPDRPASRLVVTVFRDGVALSRHETGFDRPELTGAARSARAGFDITLADLPGTHTYTVYAAHVDSTLAPAMLGGRTVSEDEDAAWAVVSA